MHDYSDTTAIVPTLNEEQNIKKMLDALLRSYHGISIIVSDDGSTDATKEIVMHIARRNSRVRFLDRSKKAVHSTTASILDAAMIVNTPKLVNIDADFQHPVQKVKPMIEKLDRYDLVIGARKGREMRRRERRFLSWSLKVIATAAFKARGFPTCSDMASGFFGFRTKVFKALISKKRSGYVEDGSKILIDTLRLIGPDARIAEVGYYYFPDRKGGASKIDRHIFQVILSSLVSVFK